MIEREFPGIAWVIAIYEAAFVAVFVTVKTVPALSQLAGTVPILRHWLGLSALVMCIGLAIPWVELCVVMVLADRKE